MIPYNLATRILQITCLYKYMLGLLDILVKQMTVLLFYKNIAEISLVCLTNEQSVNKKKLARVKQDYNLDNALNWDMVAILNITEYLKCILKNLNLKKKDKIQKR